MSKNSSIRWQYHWDKVLFALASLYFFVVIGWLVEQNQLKLPFTSEKQAETPSKPLSDSDKAFLTYLKARLALIPSPSSSVMTQPPTQTTPTLQSNLPSVAVAPPPVASPPSPTAPSVVERVYIPLYPEISETAIAPPAPSTPQRPKPQNVVIPRPSAPLPPPPPVRVNSVPVLSPGVALLPPSPTLLPTSRAKLVGTLPSGDRSYAIFQIEGKPQHVKIGEIIGSTGWILVKVEDQQITLQQNGKQRKMGVGSQL